MPGRTRHEHLGTAGEELKRGVMIEAGRQPDRLLGARQRGGQAWRLDADALVKGLMIAEAGEPRDAQALVGELAQRAAQQPRVVREAEFAREEVGTVGTGTVWSPEDVAGPVRRLHALVIGPAGIR